MSTAEAQLSQFKDALKLMKKKCTALEAKVNGKNLFLIHHFNRIKIANRGCAFIVAGFLRIYSRSLFRYYAFATIRK